MKETNEVSQDIYNKINANTVLFFDMDGTLVDTNFANLLSYKKAILSVTKSDHYFFYDPSTRFTRSTLKEAFSKLSESECERIIQKKEEYYKDFLHETRVNPVIVNLLSKYSKINKTVLVTNCRRDRASMTLEYHGLTDKFSAFFFRQMGANNEKINKYQIAIQALGISPETVIVFENEKTEIEDAIEAGIRDYNLVKF